MAILRSDEAGYLLQIPTYRVDVQRDVDVIEDILRIYGYNNVEIEHNLSYAVSHINDSKINVCSIDFRTADRAGFLRS